MVCPLLWAAVVGGWCAVSLDGDSDDGDRGGSWGEVDPLAVLDHLEAAFDEAAEVPVGCLGSQETLEWLCRVQRLQAKAQALSCRSLVEAHDLSPETMAVGRTMAGVVAAHTRANPKPVASDQHLGVWLRGFTVFAEAFGQGRLTRSHLQVLRTLDNKRTRSYLPEAQEYLIEAAETCDWSEFVALCRYWALAFDPDGPEPDEQVTSRSMSYQTDSDGTLSGRFKLDPLAGAAFTTALEQQIQRLFREDSETNSDRTATQRRADALVQLVVAGAQNPDVRLPTPLVHIVMSSQVAQDALSRLAGGAVDALTVDKYRLPLDHGDIDGRCELIDGTPIHPRFALAALASATLRRMVFGPDGEILDLGRKARGFPQHLKQALLVKARGRCQHPGCQAPVAWLQADHLMPWNRHGPTAITNGQILCDPHNKAKRDDIPPLPS